MRVFSLGLALLVTALVAFSGAPARADGPSPTPRPLPINGVTVDVQKSNPHNRGFTGGTHVERPPFVFHDRPHGHPHQPQPTPTP